MSVRADLGALAGPGSHAKGGAAFVAPPLLLRGAMNDARSTVAGVITLLLMLTLAKCRPAAPGSVHGEHLALLGACK